MVLVDFFKRIETQYSNNLPFVAYRKPENTSIKALFQNNDQVYEASTFSESGFVFSPFEAQEATILIPLEHCECIEVASEVNFENKPVFKAGNISNEAKLKHIQLVDKGIKAILDRRFSKVVLSRRETVSLGETSPINIFRNLLKSYPSALVYLWYHPKVGLWLGATPETLIKMEGSHFSIMALAGTQEYKGTTDVVWNNKEIEEQQIVTDFIVQQLKPSVENLKVSATETLRAGNLLHLKTLISAQLKPETSHLKQLIFDLHPTPAVCGFPKLAAKKFILENEPYDREFYTGFLGELNCNTMLSPRSSKKNIENRAYAITKKSSHLYVNLRCMQIQGNQAHIYVGGGITEISNAVAEWEETVSKSQIIKSIL